MSRTIRIATIVVATLLGLWFALAGSQKFLAAGVFESLFEQLGLPAALVPVIGILEIGAAALVLVPRTRLYGASLIVLIMLGAAGSHLASGLGPPAPAMIALAMAGAVLVLRLRGREAPRA